MFAVEFYLIKVSFSEIDVKYDLMTIKKLNTMKKSTFLLFAFAFLFGVRAFAQQKGFFYLNEDYAEASYYGTAAIEAADGNLFVAGGDCRTLGQAIEASNPAIIVKLSPDGQHLGTVDASPEGTFSIIYDLYVDPENSKFYYAVGKTYNQQMGKENLYLVHFDNELMLLSCSEISVPADYSYLHDMATVMSSNNRIVIVASCSNFIGWTDSCDQLYAMINLDGELEKMAEDTERDAYHSTGDVFECPDGSFRHCYNYSKPLSGQPGYVEIWPMIVSFQSDMEQLDVTFLSTGLPVLHEITPEGVYQVHDFCDAQGYTSSKACPDGSFLYDCSASEMLVQNGELAYWGDCEVFCRKDANSNEVLDYQIVGRQNDSTEHALPRHSMDYVHRYELYHCCYARRDEEMWGSNGPVNIIVTKTDENLSLIWSKSYNIAENTLPQSMLATRDGGCLVIGAITEDGTEQRKLFAFKINHDGTLNVPEVQVADIPASQVYPNPGGSEMHIRTTVENATVEVYDMNGRLVAQQPVTETETVLDATDWAAGTYVWKVISAGKDVESGKWVKE